VSCGFGCIFRDVVNAYKATIKDCIHGKWTKDFASTASLNYAIKTADNFIFSVTLANRFKREHILTRPLTFNL
jgi:hypothetical protein